ncbi:MAG: polysulfide reductase [Anaerolineae bacterium]|nr:polysulfide reductase [Anaerolineae bacterium]
MTLDLDADPILLQSLQRTTWRFYAMCGILATVLAVGLFGYITQLRRGLAVTGLNDAVSWGLYISTFVFFIGISHAGTLISAVLRVTHTEWRRAVTRMAESITVVALLTAAIFPIVDLGRPDRLLNVFLHGRIESAILWDFVSIFTYLIGSIIYLTLPMIPDAAFLRAKLQLGRFRDWLYRFLAKRWTGSPLQKLGLEKAIGIMAIIIIPVAVSVHTVVSWIFGMTLRVGWHTAILGPYFVVGAIFSGIATLLVAMGIFRRAYHLEKYITLQHFRNLAILLLVLDIAIIYFTLSDYLTAAYGAESKDVVWLTALSSGPYALLFWGMYVGGFIVPAFILSMERTRTIGGIVLAAVLVDIAMWVERFLIVVPSMAAPQIPFDWGIYQPTWVEWSITAASFAGFALMYAVFSKLFPIVSMWEVREGRDVVSEAVPQGEKVSA